jgi:hypothetical protein
MVNDDLDDMFRDDSDRKYVEVYIIHENTAPIKIHKISKFKQLPTDYVVTTGWLDANAPRGDHSMLCDWPVFASDTGGYTIDNYLSGVVFDTYEEGRKVLAQVLSQRVKNDATIYETFKELRDEYPELVI